MLIYSTYKARSELQSSVGTLGQRERQVLDLANGTHTLLDLRHALGAEAEKLAIDLMGKGYLSLAPERIPRLPSGACGRW
ncbi:MAG: hypothetical protein ABI919_14390 [Ramlibacter sp.]